MKEKRLKYFLPAECSSQRCCRPSLQQGCPPHSEPFPGGIPKARPLEIYPENGRNSALFPIPGAASLLGGCAGGGCSSTPDKGAVASPRRAASKDSKGVLEGNIRLIAARARLQSGTAAEDLAPEVPLAQAPGARCQRWKGGWAGKGESLRGWTHGLTFLDVEEEPVVTLPSFSAPDVNIHPLDLGPIMGTSRELLSSLRLRFKQQCKAAMPWWIKAHCSALTICQAPCLGACVFAQALTGNYPPYITADCLSLSHCSIPLVNILDLCLQWLKCRCWIIAMERQGQRTMTFLGVFGSRWGWKEFESSLPESADTRTALGSKSRCSPRHNAGGCYLETGPECRLMAELETCAYWKHLLFSSASHMICQNIFLVRSQLRTAGYEV